MVAVMRETVEQWVELTGPIRGYIDALNYGHRHYWSMDRDEETGELRLKPCKHGHMAPKYTNNRLCLVCNHHNRVRCVENKRATKGNVTKGNTVTESNEKSKGY